MNRNLRQRGLLPRFGGVLAAAVLALGVAVPAQVAAAEQVGPTDTAGGGHSCTRTSDGEAWCWGSNVFGGLGDGTTIERHRPVRVTKVGGSRLTRVTGIEAGSLHSCARTSKGAAWCWGLNSSGQLGNGKTIERRRAVRVTKKGGTALTGVTDVSAGDTHSCARTSNGAVWCWGQNYYGQLGDGTRRDRTRAVRVTKAGGGYLTRVVSVSVGAAHTCARTSNGAAWCWGLNSSGQLGDRKTSDRSRAARVSKAGGGAFTGVTDISAGSSHSCARTSGGAGWCWGANWYGQLGDGTKTGRVGAVRVKRAPSSNLTKVTDVDAGGFHTCARRADGTAWCWGANWSGQLGDGTDTDRRFPARVTRSGGARLAQAKAITASVSSHTCARTKGGNRWCWGMNYNGEVGDGTTKERHRAVRVIPVWRR